MSELFEKAEKQIEKQQKIVGLYVASDEPIDRYELGKITGMVLMLNLIKKYEEPEEASE